MATIIFGTFDNNRTFDKVILVDKMRNIFGEIEKSRWPDADSRDSSVRKSLMKQSEQIPGFR